MDLYELFLNGILIGVFTEDGGMKYMDEHFPESSYSMYPLGTFLKTDTE